MPRPRWWITSSSRACQENCELVDAESLFERRLFHRCPPRHREWATSKGLPEDPLDAFRQSGYLERITAERAGKNASSASSYA